MSAERASVASVRSRWVAACCERRVTNSQRASDVSACGAREVGEGQWVGWSWAEGRAKRGEPKGESQKGRAKRGERAKKGDVACLVGEQLLLLCV